MPSDPRVPGESLAASLTTSHDGETASPTLAGFLSAVERRAYRVARAALWDHELALDVVQDAMLKLLERYAQRSAAEWTPLFFTILRNRIADMQRQRRLRKGIERVTSWFTRSEAPIEIEQAGSPVDEPERRYLAQREGAALQHALAQLPERQREVFLLREWQGMSVKEAAEALACTEGTIKQHHFRALQRLRTLLVEERHHDD